MTLDEVSERLAAVTDRLAVEAVTLRYFTALDTRDWRLLRSCFTDDVASVYGLRGELHGYAAIERMCREALEPLAAVQHLVGNLEIHLAGDTARTRCNLAATHIRADGSMYVVGAVYDDVVHRTGAGWRIAHRVQTRLWTEEKTPTAVSAVPNAGSFDHPGSDRPGSGRPGSDRPGED